MVELRAAGRSEEEAEHPTHIMAFLLFELLCPETKLLDLI